MCEQTEISYLDGDVVWVKLGSCWWPGEVVGPEKLPPDVLPSFRKPPIAVVKFFQENSYEYVKNINNIYKYNCSRKNEFINKGLYMYRSKHGHMEKFPEDVIRAETAVGGDIEILTRDEFQEQKKESYAGLFGDKKATPNSGKRGRGKGRPTAESPKLTSPQKFLKEKSDYKVHILVQPSKETPTKESTTQVKDGEKEKDESTPSTSRAGSEVADDTPKKTEPPSNISTPNVSSAGIYSCPTCNFSTSRLNVLILHNKTHSVGYVPYTPSPVRKKPGSKSPTKSTPKTQKSPKTPRPRKEKTDKEKAPKKETKSKKRTAEDKPHVDVKKPKTDEEIKSSLLADWDDDEVDDESTDETSLLLSRSPGLPVGPQSPAAPTPAELPAVSTSSSPEKKSSEASSEKPESSDSKYEFCEDEDWAVEADGGRKIPRVKNSSKRRDGNKSLSLDENDVAKEVAELLNSTAMPDLPSIPEPLKAEENFPEPSVAKSPDKKVEPAPEPSQPTENTTVAPKPTKAIFKTKTFFRSRHSRSQDAIGKYVAEQLNPERLDLADSDLNGSEVVSSPEMRESPPVDHVKVARLAPKIQLKKMKAEAAQLEKERHRLEALEETRLEAKQLELPQPELSQPFKPTLDVIYPTQEIKPINKDTPEKIHHKEEHKDLLLKLGADKMKSTSEVSNVLHEDVFTKSCHKKLPNEILEGDSIKISNVHVDSKAIDEPQNEILMNTGQGINAFSMDYTPTTPVQNKKLAHVGNVKSESLQNQETIAHFENFDNVSHQKHAIEATAVSMEIGNQETHENKEKVDLASPKARKSVEVVSPKKTPVKIPSSILQKTYEQLIEPYMSDSTASAVDALLSVSREADRVPKIVSSGPPEDLFEDDNKETSNDELIPAIDKETVHYQEQRVEETLENVQDFNQEKERSTEEALEPTKDKPKQNNDNINDTQETTVIDNVPSESDLQIAETLLNLPSTAIQNPSNETQEKSSTPMSIDDQPFEEVIATNEVTIDDNKSYEINENNEISPELFLTNNKNLNVRYETEQEKSENLNAAQSLVQMSESIEHAMNVVDNKSGNVKETSKASFSSKQNNGHTASPTVEQKVESLSAENSSEPTNGINKVHKFESTSKLLKILEEPIKPARTIIKPTTPMKQIVVTGKEKILNYDVAKSPLKSKVMPTPPKQKIIIRRTGTGAAKTLINNLNSIGEVVASPDKIILSRTNVPGQEGSSVQTFTIQTSTETIATSDPKQIIIQPKPRKITKTTTKLQKIKPHNSLIQWTEQKNEPRVSEEAMFDINSMPVVLSDDILTPENIDKMPIVMSDGNIITSTANITVPQDPPPPKLIKTTKPKIIENEKIAISASPNKSEMKTLLMNPTPEVSKVTTPNILSKSSKLRGTKTMVVIDKATGLQKVITAKGELPKELKPAQTILQPAQTILQPAPQQKTEKFIIIPTGGTSRSGRTQKFVIDPQTGKTHILVAKGQETLSLPENKPVSAKLIPSSSDAATPGNTVMIITNAQGAQSRIVLTPEHEKILFPNKIQPTVSQLKPITQRVSSNATVVSQKTVVSSASPAKPPPRIVPKQQKSAIITSKGQLIVGGRVATTAQNIAPMPEVRPVPKESRVPKRIVASEPKKLVQAIQKTTSEPLIFLQQKSGAVMQLTAAQFEHLQRTGQIIQKVAPPENKIVVQKSITISPKDGTAAAAAPARQRVRKTVTSSPLPAKKQAPALAAAPTHSAATPPPLAALSAPRTIVDVSAAVPPVSNTISISTSANFSDLDNLDELLPSTAIVKQPEAPPPPPAPEPAPEPPPAQLSDGQLLAVPGENFGGPPGSFYLCIEDNGSLTPIDNRPLVLENNQLVPMAEAAPAPERQDILQAALANSEVFHAEPDAPDFRDLNANVSVHCRVSETSTTLHQPIMSPAELPSSGAAEPGAVPASLEAGLAVIGVTPHAVPTSLELPITVTDPRIAPRAADPLGGYAPLASPAADAGISMPLLTDEEAGGGKSMPILTDEVCASSVESMSSLEADEGWGRLPTPHTDASDASEASAEIPLQPPLSLRARDLASPHT